MIYSHCASNCRNNYCGLTYNGIVPCYELSQCVPQCICPPHAPNFIAHNWTCVESCMSSLIDYKLHFLHAMKEVDRDLCLSIVMFGNFKTFFQNFLK